MVLLVQTNELRLGMLESLGGEEGSTRRAPVRGSNLLSASETARLETTPLIAAVCINVRNLLAAPQIGPETRL